MARKVLITAALPYANGKIHLGHLRSTYVPGDIYSRYTKLRGYDSVYVCATDEHGSPIEIKAKQAGKTPEEFVQYYREKDAYDFTNALVQFDNFYHTHSDEGRALATEFYEKAKTAGSIYDKEVEQFYCEFDKRFLPDRYLKGTCPHCKSPDQYSDGCEVCGKVYKSTDVLDPKCATCGKPPVRQKSTHKFFKLSAYSDFLYNYFVGNELLPQDVTAYLQNWIKEGLQDWDITRDGPYFGFELPDSKNQYFYVWWDAPIGYMAATVNWAAKNAGSWKSYWQNEDCEINHFIGKDIIYHHYLFWPAMLKAAGYTLPTRIPVRGYLNIKDAKMSKSRGTFIYADEFLKKYPAEYLRYYLTATTPNHTSDANWDWKEFQTKVNSELIDAWGNYAYRVLSFLNSKYDGVVPEPADYSEDDKRFMAELDNIAAEVEHYYEEAHFKEALEKIMGFVNHCNKYYNDRAPWKLLKEKNLQGKTVLYLSTKAVYAAACLLAPILPKSSIQVLEMLNLPPKAKWNDWTAIKPGQKVGTASVLYKKIEDDQIALETGEPVTGTKPDAPKILSAPKPKATP